MQSVMQMFVARFASRDPSMQSVMQMFVARFASRDPCILPGVAMPPRAKYRGLSTSVEMTTLGCAYWTQKSLVRQWLQRNRTSRLRRLSCCIENLHHDHIRVERREISIRLDLSTQHAGQIVE